MPPKKKAKSIIIDAIDDLERDFEPDDENDLNVCKVSLGRWRNIKHWKKVNQSFADEYEIDADTLQQRSMSYIQLIPVENLDSLSPDWKDCFLAETERYLTLNFNDWRIRPDDQIAEVFEDYQQKKSRDDAIYRFMFRRLDSSYISKAILAYTKLSCRPPRCLFYLLKYMITVSPDAYHIYDVIDFIYTRQDLTHQERIDYKKSFIFEVFPAFLDRLIGRKRNKQWRTPFLYTLRMLVELHYENHDPDKRALKMIIHLFKSVANYRQYPKITADYGNLSAALTDLKDYHKSRQTSGSIADDISIKSEDTENDIQKDPLRDNCSSDKDTEAIVFHSIFLYTLAWIQFLDARQDMCFLVEYFDPAISPECRSKRRIPSRLRGRKSPSLSSGKRSTGSSMPSSLCLSLRASLNANFADVFKSFFSQTKMDSLYYSKQMLLAFQLLDGSSGPIEESLKSLLTETRQFPVFTFIDIHLAQIGNCIRSNKFQEALPLLITFCRQLPALFPQEETQYDPKRPRKLPKNIGKEAGSDGEEDCRREIHARPVNLDNVVDVVVNYLMAILIRQLTDKKLYEVSLEKLVVLAQHNWPQYCTLLDFCLSSFETSGAVVLPSFGQNVFQTSLIEQLSGLKHRSPNVRFVLTPDRADLSGDLARQVLLGQIEKSVKELPTVFYLNFILSLFPVKLP